MLHCEQHFLGISLKHILAYSGVIQVQALYWKNNGFASSTLLAETLCLYKRIPEIATLQNRLWNCEEIMDSQPLLIFGNMEIQNLTL